MLVYLYSEDEPEKQNKALKLVQNHENRWISTQVLNELSNTLRKKFKLEYTEIEKIVCEVCENFQVAIVQAQTIKTALKTAATYRYSYYDSLIVTTALDLSCNFLYSEDMQHGQLIDKRLKIVNPFS